jgi:hypothetical protein
LKIHYPGINGLAQVLAMRHSQYNRSMALIDDMETDGAALVVRFTPLGIGRVDRNKNRL